MDETAGDWFYTDGEAIGVISERNRLVRQPT